MTYHQINLTIDFYIHSVGLKMVDHDQLFYLLMDYPELSFWENHLKKISVKLNYLFLDLIYK